MQQLKHSTMAIVVYSRDLKFLKEHSLDKTSPGKHHLARTRLVIKFGTEP